MGHREGSSFVRAIGLIYLLQTTTIVAASGNSEQRITLETFVKNFDIVNDYLELQVDSDNVNENMAKAREWLKVEMSRIDSKRSKSLIMTLERFTELSDLQTNRTRCNRLSSRILQNNDAFLGNWAHLSGGNYPLTRVDKIIETIAYKFAVLCKDIIGNLPELSYGYKRNMFNLIDVLLTDQVLSQKIEANMDKAFELFNRVSLIQEEGALTDALRLLTSLKSASNNCSEESSIIIERNLLALDSTFRPLKLERRVDQLIWHYSSKFKIQCRYLFPKIFMTLSQQFNDNVLRTMRTLLSESFIKDSQETETARAQFKYNFTTPELVLWAEKVAPENANCFYIHEIQIGALRKTIQTLSFNDTDKDFLNHNVSREGKIAALYEKYLVGPCKDYRKTINKMFGILFSRLYLSSFFEFWEDESPPYLGFTFGQVSYGICEKLINRKGEHIKKLMQQQQQSTDYLEATTGKLVRLK